MAIITHIPADPEYVRECETPRWYDGKALPIILAIIVILIAL